MTERQANQIKFATDTILKVAVTVALAISGWVAYEIRATQEAFHVHCESAGHAVAMERIDSNRRTNELILDNLKEIRKELKDLSAQYNADHGSHRTGGSDG